MFNKSLVSRSGYRASGKAYIHMDSSSVGLRIINYACGRGHSQRDQVNMYIAPLSSGLNMKCLINHQFQEVGIVPPRRLIYIYMDSSAVGFRIINYAHGRGHL